MALHRPVRTTSSAIALTLALGAALVGCSSSPFSAPLSTTVATPTPTITTPAKVDTIPNELANGTTVHQLKAGNIGLSVNYFSTLLMNKWYATAAKPVSLSMTASAPVPKKQKIYLASLSATTAVFDAQGNALASPPDATDQATVSPGYLVKKPYTYSETFIIPAIDVKAAYITMTFTYQLLLQSTPTSNIYAKQTTTDTLTIAIAQP